MMEAYISGKTFLPGTFPDTGVLRKALLSGEMGGTRREGKYLRILNLSC